MYRVSVGNMVWVVSAKSHYECLQILLSNGHSEEDIKEIKRMV